MMGTWLCPECGTPVPDEYSEEHCATCPEQEPTPAPEPGTGEE